MSYTPQPGTTADAFRAAALQWLRDRGGEASSADLASALGVDRRLIRDYLASPDTKSLGDQSGVAQLAARRAHNPEVGGSNPPPASNTPTAGPATRFEGRGGDQRDGVPPDATDRRPRQSLPEPEGAAAIAGGAARPKETAHRGAAHNGAGDDAKPAVGAGAPEGSRVSPKAAEALFEQLRPSTEPAPLRFALWSDGVLEIRGTPMVCGGGMVRFSREQARQLVEYLEAISLEPVRGEGA